MADDWLDVERAQNLAREQWRQGLASARANKSLPEAVEAELLEKRTALLREVFAEIDRMEPANEVLRALDAVGWAYAVGATLAEQAGENWSADARRKYDGLRRTALTALARYACPGMTSPPEWWLRGIVGSTKGG